MKTYTIFVVITFIYGSLLAEVLQFPDANGVEKEVIESFPDIFIENESFEFYEPKLLSVEERLGLIVYLSPSDNFSIPDSLRRICEVFRFAVIAPRDIGNKHNVERRIAVPVIGTLRALEEGTYDRNRVYLLGYSGGGRMGSRIMFYYPEIFTACLSICGFDYNKEIEFLSCLEMSKYGFFNYSNAEKETKLKNRKLAVLTGSGDFRNCFLQDIVKGYKEGGYRIELFDYKGYGHEFPSYRELKDVLTYFEK